ncbi:TRAP transporter substrate-binding protein [Methyloceanibacter sp.]|uniref:TRAP transporter substrate-binding protein n=1 Tax=Methyloceanibacter sp. TaxID=1965321 RepID=UPI003567D171
MGRRSAISKGVSKGAVSGALGLAMVLLGSAPAVSETATFATPIAYGTHLPGLGTQALTLARSLKKRSDGQIVLDLKEPGDGTLPHEILDKVSDGKVDAGFATASFWAAKVPATPLFGGFPFGPDASGYVAWFEHGNGRALYQEMYDQAKLKVHVIPCGFGGAEAGIWSKQEIADTKDLDGLRVRIFGLGARVLSRLGAVPVLVPGGQLPQAFKEDKIAAAELYTPAVDRAKGLQDAVKLIYGPGWHQPATLLELLINKDRWDALGKGQQDLIESTCQVMLRSSRAESAGLQAAALASLRTEDNVQIARLPDGVLKALREAWGEVAKEEGARDYFFKQVLEDIAKFEAAEAAPQAPAPEALPPASEGAPKDKPDPAR